MNNEQVRKYLHLIGSAVCPTQIRDGWIVASCPLAKTRHSKGVDNNPSFAVRIDTDRPSRFHCFSCGSSGDLMDIIILSKLENPYGLEHMQIDKALQMLAAEDDQSMLEAIVFEDNVSIQGKAINYFSDSYLQSFQTVFKSKLGLDYLKSRGVSKELIKKMDIRYDTNTDRVVMPIRDWTGGLVGMHGRSVLGGFSNPYYAYRENGKYNAIVWYGEQFINPQDQVILVESVFDLLNVMQYYPNVLCSLTAGISKVKVERLSVLNNLVTIADTGKGGTAWKKAIDKHLSSHVVQHIDLEEYDDQADDAGSIRQANLYTLLESEFIL